MRIDIVAVGRLKEPEEKAIVERYCRRLEQMGRAHGLGPVSVSELAESRASSAEHRKADEARRLLQTAPPGFRIALDPQGRGMSSEDFASELQFRANSGTKACSFLIGGADGLGPEVLGSVELRLSLGSWILPHGLARVVLAEQLYRAATILSNHPYHRA